jgi:putative N6-adenine-specific DNA methylase
MSLIPCYATTAPGLERLLIAELTALGVAVGAAEVGGVDFEATAPQLADALLWLRTANRVTVRLASFAGRTFGELERHAGAIDWTRVAPPGTAVHFRITSKKSRLYHEDAIAERLEKSVLAAGDHLTVVRQPSAAEELEADVSVAPAVQRIVVRLHRDQVSVSADASGGLLHRRGWRQEVAKAPLRETLAAAMLSGIEWGGSAGQAGHATVPLHDPFCGSGTIPIEAALLARRMAPGRGRRFAAEAWPEFGTEFSAARARATRVELARSPVSITGSDRDHGAIDAALANAERAGVSADVEFSRGTISDLVPDTSRGWLVGNPPYGSRVGERQELRSLYAKLGNVLHTRRPNWRLALLVNDPMLAGQVGVEFEEIWRTTNGGIAVRLVAS